MSADPEYPAIRSYHHRNGRMGTQLQHAWQEVAPGLMLPDSPWGADLLSGPGITEVVLEVGSGMGHSVLGLAAAQPETLVIANDVSIRCMAATARGAAAGGLTNVRLFRGDAMHALTDLVSPQSLSGIHVWFPDPWPKSAHHKRRLIRPLFLDLAALALRPRGVLRFATDWPDYATAARTVLAAHPRFEPLGADGVVGRPDLRPMTKYERRGLDAGRPIVDLAFLLRPGETGAD